jgi:hypothetical protein
MRGERLGETLYHLIGGLALRHQVKEGQVWITAAPLRAAIVHRRKQEKVILMKLEQAVDLHLEKVPLEEALRVAAKATKGGNEAAFVIYCDPAGLEEAGVTPENPVSIEAHGTPLKDALTEMLKPLNLTYRVKDGLLTITSSLDDFE